VIVDATLELAIGVKLIRVLLPPYSLIGPAAMPITEIFVTAQEVLLLTIGVERLQNYLSYYCHRTV
jgi:hypothetical protein